MKRKIFMGLVGLLSMGVMAVNAEEVEYNGEALQKNVMVGEVEAPVYKATITWGDLTFDSVYNNVTQKREWREKIDCVKISESDSESNSWFESEFNSIKASGWNDEFRLYSDENCEKELNYNEDTEYEDISFGYFDVNKDGEAGLFTITDSSVNGRLIPTLSWTPTRNYDYVKAVFKQNIYDTEKEAMYYHNIDSNKLTEKTSGSGAGALGDTSSVYELKLTLQNDETKEIKDAFAGDKIGTLTITFDNI